MISIVNTKIVLEEDISLKLGVMKTTPIHPAARLMNNPENVRSQGLVKDICMINFNYIKSKISCQFRIRIRVRIYKLLLRFLSRQVLAGDSRQAGIHMKAWNHCCPKRYS